MATRTAIRQRLDIQAEAPDAWEAMVALDAAIGLDESLRVLVKLRASLINGCVYCIDLHSREGFGAGERPERLFGLASWRESPFFDERERAALALTDAVTLVADGHVSDEIWQEASRHFDADERGPVFVVMPDFVPHESCGWPEFDEQTDAVVLGRVALDAGLAASNWPWPGKQIFVLTSRPVPAESRPTSSSPTTARRGSSSDCELRTWRGTRSCWGDSGRCTPSSRSGRSTGSSSSSFPSSSGTACPSHCPARRGGGWSSRSTMASPTAPSATSTRSHERPTTWPLQVAC